MVHLDGSIFDFMGAGHPKKRLKKCAFRVQVFSICPKLGRIVKRRKKCASEENPDK